MREGGAVYWAAFKKRYETEEVRLKALAKNWERFGLPQGRISQYSRNSSFVIPASSTKGRKNECFMVGNNNVNRPGKGLDMSDNFRRSLTISVFIPDVDVAVLEAGALFGVFVALDLGDEGRLSRFLVACGIRNSIHYKLIFKPRTCLNFCFWWFFCE